MTPTLDDFFADWLRTVDVKPKTRAAYAGAYARLAPILGRTPVDAVTPLDVTRALASLRSAGAAPATRRLARSALSSAFAAAVHTWRLVDSNPVAGVKAERSARRAHTRWTREERARFLAAAATTPEHGAYVLASILGLRVGEILALRWGDVDFAAERVNIRHTLVEIDGVIRGLAPAKSAESRRSLKLPTAVVHILRGRYRGAPPEAYVFSTDGRPLLRSTMHRRFKAAIEVAGVKEIRFHDLRHTAATLLLAAGVPVKTVSRILGHASTAITMDVYQDVIEAHEAAADAVMAGAFSFEGAGVGA